MILSKKNHPQGIDCEVCGGHINPRQFYYFVPSDGRWSPAPKKWIGRGVQLIACLRCAYPIGRDIRVMESKK